MDSRSPACAASMSCALAQPRSATSAPLPPDNLEAVLGEAGMSLADLVRLNVYTTDVDRLFEHYGVLAARLGAAGAAPPTTMLGVTRLAIPDLTVELEGTAVA
ncbi:RidA family protein [Planomonospora sp. ID82291]|uniref:RidA family protein n=1 Tax=Planomonospora sp. ID82291 TaxID=2738136 RepID=UPI0035AB953C